MLGPWTDLSVNYIFGAVDHGQHYINENHTLCVKMRFSLKKLLDVIRGFA